MPPTAVEDEDGDEEDTGHIALVDGESLHCSGRSHPLTIDDTFAHFDNRPEADIAVVVAEGGRDATQYRPDVFNNPEGRARNVVTM